MMRKELLNIIFTATVSTCPGPVQGWASLQPVMGRSCHCGLKPSLLIYWQLKDSVRTVTNFACIQKVRLLGSHGYSQPHSHSKIYGIGVTESGGESK